MANIAITKYCNLNCSYCFAETMLEERERKNIEIKQFKKILKWINKTDNNERIGIIGGEPTLHPEFSKILFILNHFCSITNRPSIIFTNGIYLQPYIELIGKNTSVLININSPNSMNKEQYNKLLSTLNYLYQNKKINKIDSQYTIGCNITQNIQDYSFFWDIVEKYQIPKARFSIVSPTKQEEKENKDLYYKKMKPIFLQFIREAINHNILLSADCSQIPSCYFSNEELKLISTIIEDFDKNSFCTPVVDITADFKACSCFGTYDPIDCKQFDNIEQLESYLLLKINYEKTLLNNSFKCRNCEKYKLLKCQGGCLAFANSVN